MKSVICGFAILTLSRPAQGQETFHNLYSSTPSYTFDLNELPSHRVFTCMGATHLLNANGTIENSSVYVNGGTNRTQTLKMVSPGLFYFTTSTVPASCPQGGGSNSLVHPVIGMIDTVGATAEIRKYELNDGVCYGPAGGLAVTAEKGAFIWGRNRNGYALRVDSTLEHVWSRRLLHNGGFQFIEELPGGDLLVGINTDSAAAVVSRWDAEGNVIWSKSYMRPRGMVHDALVLSDSSFIITGYTDTTSLSVFDPLPASFQPKLYLMHLNGAGEVQWCKGWFSTPFLWYSGRPSRIVRTLDGNFAVLANIGAGNYNFEYRPYLMKTDLNGDTLWTRSIGLSGYVYLAQNLLASSDGGYVMSGVIYGDLPGGNTGLMYIFKTDSLGHFDCQEHYNPVQAVNLFPADSSFTLSMVAGSATAVPVYVTDSILDPSIFTTYDGCTFSTDIPPSMDRGRHRPLEVRPNPNTGRFTLLFNDPLMADSFYSVYDALGKLLYQQRWPPGKQTEEVDLSRFGAGTYVIRFASPEGSCYERVVVE